ncbi:hypothetical protein DVH24_018436 [Malus domestica]|uniref:Uncharacterized protein n=1 Tax=Malus domestica TaxID=3750 RepID=A0A498KJ15_MALDO|nr:hypothetical protein DVH24_018436 [Malus domestica]
MEMIASSLANISCRHSGKKKLVESLGELLLVDKYWYGNPWRLIRNNGLSLRRKLWMIEYWSF